ncbi:hypothetical protein AB0331_15680 [Dietzia maris]|uniref:hypothetical protein n=1 Tax=Dietzia maris TaxID=37915 RepID=UPI00344E1058
MTTTPRAVITPCEDNPKNFVVSPDWSAFGVDRPISFGVVVSNRKVAERLARAIEDGAVYPFKEILTDVNGQTYVGAGHNVLARCMNADLTRLGY